MNIAIIGGGLAGLVAAWLLSQRPAITLFERHAQPGFAVCQVAVPPRASRRYRSQSMTIPTTPALEAALTPERWSLSAGDAATATLHIPPDAKRQRRFEIACAATVGVPEDVPATAWLQLTVQANGAQQWRRRLPANNPGEFDGLDYRFSRSVPVGHALRITVSVAGHGVRRQALVIEADEL